MVLLREIEIIMERMTFSPGEQVEGYVYVRTDKEFEYNAITLTLSGAEQTEVERSSGDDRRTYRDKYEHINETVHLSGPGLMSIQGQRLDFALILPHNIPGTYIGRGGRITYELVGKIEVSWARDPETKYDIVVTHTYGQVKTNRKVGFIDHEGVTFLEVDLEKDVVEIGQDFITRIKLNPVTKFRGVRMELIHEEEVIASGYHDTTRRIISGWQLTKDEVPPNTWLDVGMQTDVEFPKSFRGHLIDSRYLLKFTMDRPWRADKKLETPVAVTTYDPSRPSEPWF